MSAVTFMLRLFVLATLLVAVFAIQEEQTLRLQQLVPLFAVMSFVALREFWSRVSHDPDQRQWGGSLAWKTLAAGSMIPALLGLVYTALILALPLYTDLSAEAAALYTAGALAFALLLAQAFAHFGTFDVGVGRSLRTRSYQLAMLKGSDNTAIQGAWVIVSLRPIVKAARDLEEFSGVVWDCDGKQYWSNEQLSLLASYFNWLSGELDLPTREIHGHVATVHFRPGSIKHRVLRISEAKRILTPFWAHVQFRLNPLASDLSTLSGELDLIERSSHLNLVDSELFARIGLEMVPDEQEESRSDILSGNSTGQDRISSRVLKLLTKLVPG